MGEIQPAITYSPKGVLSILRGVSPEAEAASPTTEEDRDAVTAKLAQSFDGVRVEESDGLSHVHIAVAEALDSGIATIELRARSLLSDISTLLPSREEAVTADHVILPTLLEPQMIRAWVYPQFQRWMNQDGLTQHEDITRDCLLAMAKPFGLGKEERVRESFECYVVDDTVIASGGGLEVIGHEAKFSIDSYEPDDGGEIKTGGEAAWDALSLNGHGDSGLGVHAAERHRLRVSSGNRELYRIVSHNIDHATEALSLLLGLGSLAHHAAQYEGSEDLFAGATWEQTA